MWKELFYEEIEAAAVLDKIKRNAVTTDFHKRLRFIRNKNKKLLSKHLKYHHLNAHVIILNPNEKEKLCTYEVLNKNVLFKGTAEKTLQWIKERKRNETV